ncbi:MAG: hypothetical protein EBY47_08675, partial [Actinobacteria bacterium]|nr:hypothetical protein [Actinomycetota bacterium]
IHRFSKAQQDALLPGVGLAAPLSFTIGTSEPVVVDTTETDEPVGSASLASSVDASSVEEGSASSSTDEVSSSVALCEAVASEDEESSELEHATRDPAEANAAAVKRASLREYMCAWCT